MKYISIIILFFITQFTFSLNSRDFTKEGINPLKEPMLTQDFTLYNLSGDKVSLSDYKGKVVLLNFWASWCPPCRAEMPSIESLHSKIKGLDIVILTVNLGDSKKVTSDFIEKNKYTFEVLLDTNNEIGTLYSVRSIPTTFFINTKSEIVAYKVGSREWDDSAIVNLLKLIE